MEPSANEASSAGSWLDRVEGPIFQALNDAMAPVSEWAKSQPPLVWKWAAVGLFLMAALGAVLVPRRYIFAGAPDGLAWRDLRFWAVVALVPYMVIYYFL